MAKTISDENIRLNIIINGNSAQKELLDLEKSTREITKANKELSAAKAKLVAEGKKETQEYKNISAEIKANNVVIGQNKTKMTALQKEIGVTGLTMHQLTQRARLLKLQLANAIPGGEAAKKYGTELNEVNARIKELRGSASNATTTFAKFKNGLASVGFPVSAAMLFTQAITGTIAKMKELVTASVDLEEAQANVMKTTGYTKQQVDALTESLKKLNTRTPINELLGLAEAGGRVNLTGKELEDFVVQTDIAFVALGDSLEGSAEEIGLILGKIAGNFDLDKKYGIGTSISKIGSSLNELGANSKATEGPMVDFIKRLAGVSQQAGITLPDLAALGALFDENGQSVEVSATTFNKLLPAIGKDVERFAKIAGVNVTDFRKIVEEDAFEALVLVAKGAQSNQKGLEGLSETLENYGIDSARAASVVGILSSKTDRLTELQKISNDAFEEGTSILTEFDIKNETLGATLSKIGNTLLAKFTGSAVNDFLKGLATGFFNIIKPAEDSTKAIEKERLELLIIESKIKDVNISNEDRLKLINQLKDQYPILLSNINAETVSNGELSKSLKKVNEQLINKIILQEKDSEIEKQNAITGQKMIDLMGKEDEVRSRLIKLADKHNISLKDNATLQEQAQDVIKRIGISGGVLVDPVAKLSHELNNLKVIQRDLNNEESKGNKLIEEKKGLYERLNVSQDVLKPGGGKTVPTKEDPAGDPNDPIGGSVGGDAGGKTTDTKDVMTPEDQAIADSKKKLAEFLADFEADQDLQKELLKFEEEQREEEESVIRIENKFLKMAEEAGFETILAAGLEEAKQAEIDAVRKKYADKKIKDKKKNDDELEKLDKKNKDAQIKAENDLAQAKRDILTAGIGLLKSFFKEGSAMYKAMFGLEKALAIADVIIKGIQERATIAATWGAVPAVSVPMMAASKIRTAIGVATIVGTAIKGFEDGLYPVTREQDGKQFNAVYGGETKTGLVDRPTIFSSKNGNFLAGEKGRSEPELIIDGAAYKQINPDIKYALHREIARVKGFESGYYPEASRQPASVDGVSLPSNSNDALLTAALNRNSDILEKLDTNGVIAYMSNDLKNAKEIKDSIADYDKLRDKNKR